MPQEGSLRLWLLRSRKSAIAFLGALSLYAAFGFLLIPRIIDGQIHSRARTLLDREARVGGVRFNPFTLALTISKLSVSDRDGTDLLALDTFHANFELSGLFRRALRLSELRIEHPVLAARILQDGRPSVADLMESKTGAKDSGPSLQLPRLIVDRLIVTGGAIQFSDASRQPAYASRFDPLSLDVRNLITIPDEKGEHTITIGIENGAVLRWTGQQTVEPLRLAGRLDITGLSLRRLWDYFGQDQHLDMTDGRLDVVLPYEIGRGSDERIQVKMEGASATIRSLSVGPRGQKADWLTIPDLRIVNVSAAWPAARVEVGSVRAIGPTALALVEQDGTLNWSRAFPRTGEPSPDSNLGKWQFRIGSVEIENGSVDFGDMSMQPEMKLTLADLSVRADGISSKGATPVPLTVKARIQEGVIEASGMAVPTPAAADLDVEVRGVDLAPLRPYIANVSSARLASGTASLRGHVAVSSGASAMKISAAGTLDNVELQGPLGDRLASWQRMAIEGLTFEDPQGRARVRRIVVDRPDARILINRDGHLNFTELTSSSSPRTKPASSKQGQALMLEIGTVELRDGTAEFGDQSLVLPFQTEIHTANGTLRDLSSYASTSATLALEGRVDKTGYVKIDGALRLANPLASSEIGVGFRDIDMLALNPYFAQFAGYAVRSGAMDLDIRYRVMDRRLIGDHTVRARNMVLGDRIKDSKAPGLPIRLAVALLKDKDGRINIDVPVEGTVDSPEFDYGAVFWTAIRTISANAAKAPFRAIGRLFGKDQDDLELVEFDPGRSDLFPADEDMLSRVAEQIGPRQELVLTVEGRFDPVSDLAALRQKKLEQLIEARRQSAAATVAPGGSTLETILESLFVEQFSTDALQMERQRFTSDPAPASSAADRPLPSERGSQTAPSGFDAAGFYESLRARLFEAQPVTAPDLEALGSARAAMIVAALTKSGAIESVRVSVAKPVPAKRKKAGTIRVASEMTMAAQGDSQDTE